MNYAPYRLSEGLVLEESGSLLPWFRSLEQLAGKGGKPLPEKGKHTQLFWETDAVFGGMNVSVQAMERGLGIFFLDLKNGEKFESAKLEYEAVLQILKAKFGEPAEAGSDDYGYPWVRWRWGEVCVNLALAERFMDYVALSVSNGVVS